MTLDPSKLREDIVNESLIKTVIRSKYGEEVVFKSFESKVGSEKGDNFVGDLVAVNVIVEDVSTKEEKTLHWMMKVLKPGPDSGEKSFSQIMGLFDREEAFYVKFLKDLDTYVKPNLLRTCGCIYTRNVLNEEILVFENLKYQGFREPHNKKKGLSFEHGQEVLKWLARLHGASHVLFSKYPGGYEAWFEENFYAQRNFVKHMKVFEEAFMKDQISRIECLLDGSEDDEVIKEFKGKYETFNNSLDDGQSFYEKLEEITFTPRSSFHVLCHGDPWFNNMLFKYNDKNEIEDTILLDMQVIYSGNLGTDLGAFLSSGFEYEFLKANLDKLLSIYYETLIEFVEGIDPSLKIPISLEEVKEDVKKSSLIAYIFSAAVLPIILVEKEELLDVDYSKIDFSSKEAFGDTIQNDQERATKLLLSDLLKTVPFIYSVNQNNYEVLVFENLSYLGFRDPVNKKLGLEMEACKAALHWLAELHGASFVLFKNYPGGFEAWKKDNFFSNALSYDLFANFEDMYVSGIFDTLNGVLDGTDNDKLIIQFKEQFSNWLDNREEGVQKMEKILNESYTSRSDFHILCHGDPWFNNMLFKYDDKGNIIETILLDLQLTYSGNVGADLSYFLFSCSTHEFISKNLDTLLKSYYDHLVSFVDSLKPGVKIPLSFDELKEDFRKSWIVGFMFCIKALPFVITNDEEILSVEFSKLDFKDEEGIKKMKDTFGSLSHDFIKKYGNLQSRLLGAVKLCQDLKAFE